MPPTDLANKVILITGAGSGIGRATALKLSSLGCRLQLCDIDAAGVQATSKACHDLAGNLPTTAAFDVADATKCAEFVADVVKHAGRIDGVLNCAGINPRYTPVEEVTDAYWDRLMNVNLKGTFNFTRAALPHMTSGSSFVNVSSICGLGPSAGFSVYCATKYAVIGFSKSVALEVGARGIRVNIIAPGYIDTPTNASVVAGQESMDRSAARTALKRLGTAEEIADVVAFLFSSDSKYMTGSVVEIDGGLA